ncbi:MAG: response regulator [Pseudomonadota bacterium]
MSVVRPRPRNLGARFLLLIGVSFTVLFGSAGLLIQWQFDKVLDEPTSALMRAGTSLAKLELEREARLRAVVTSGLAASPDIHAALAARNPTAAGRALLRSTALDPFASYAAVLDPRGRIVALELAPALAAQHALARYSASPELLDNVVFPVPDASRDRSVDAYSDPIEDPILRAIGTVHADSVWHYAPVMAQGHLRGWVVLALDWARLAPRLGAAVQAGLGRLGYPLQAVLLTSAPGRFPAPSQQDGPDASAWVDVADVGQYRGALALVLRYDRDAVAAPRRATTRWLLFTGVALVLCAMAMAYLVLRIVLLNRLRQVCAATRELTGAQPGAPVARCGTDELELLAAAVDEMARRCRSSHHEIECLVDARTADLADANAALCTERDQAVALAERAEVRSRVKDQFLATMSRELRTPLHGVNGMAEILEDAVLPGEQAEAIRVVGDCGRDLLRLIDTILDFSRLHAGESCGAERPIDIAAVIDDVVATQASTALAREVEFEVTAIPAMPGEMLGDPTQLRLALKPLIDNAVKFSGGTKVHINTHLRPLEAEGTFELTLAVRDNGPGIRPEQQATLLAHFNHADGLHTSMRSGIGLGLTIAINAAHLMGGAVGLRSEPGRGSTFSITAVIKAAEHFPRRLVSTGAGTEILQDVRVLLVDDNDTNRRVVAAMLAREPCEVSEASSGREAVERAASKGYDAILMDCHMPEMDGYETTARIRAARRESGLPQPVIVALTADAMPGNRERCIAAGMDDYLTKPVIKSTLIKTLSTHLLSRTPGANVGLENANVDPPGPLPSAA